MSEWTENRPTRGWRALDVAEAWRYRHLIATFARRDVTVRYRQAFLGAAWAALLPLSGAVIFTIALTADEQAAFDASAAAVRELVAKLD